MPAADAYRPLNTIVTSAVWAITLSIIISIVLAYYFTQNNYSEVYSIIRIFEQAELGEELPAPKARQNNPYFFILESVINVFVTQSYMREQLNARKYELLSTQMAALQYQINPHFLFNTLQSIDLEVHKNQQGTAAKSSRMINQLSAILRYSLDHPMKPTPIRHEIEMAKNYMSIQKYRYGNRFEAIWEYDEDVLECHTLRLLLQPMLENALTHALRENASPTLIKVCIRKQGSLVRFKVIDNGLGIHAAHLAKIKQDLGSVSDEKKNSHIGLANVNRRLILKYPKQDGLKISSKYGVGTRICFVIEV